MRMPIKMFAEAMERKLSARDKKFGERGWKEESIMYLYARLREEMGELEKALDESLTGEYSPEVIADECVDVGNFAMMIYDILG